MRAYRQSTIPQSNNQGKSPEMVIGRATGGSFVTVPDVGKLSQSSLSIHSLAANSAGARDVGSRLLLLMVAWGEGMISGGS